MQIGNRFNVANLLLGAVNFLKFIFMKHYVENLEVKPIKINGIDTATFSEEQFSYCGLKLNVKSRNEFATSVNGWCEVDCPECLAKFKERISKPFDCENCKAILEENDIHALSPMDEQRLCLKCR